MRSCSSRPIAPASSSALEVPEVGVEAPVEPDDELDAGPFDVREALAHAGAVEIDGLLAEDVLAGRRPRLYVVRVGGGRGGDDDRGYVGVRECGLGVHRLRSVRRRHRLRRGPVHVHHEGELCPGMPRNALDMDLRDPPGPQQCNPVHPPVTLVGQRSPIVPGWPPRLDSFAHGALQGHPLGVVGAAGFVPGVAASLSGSARGARLPLQRGTASTARGTVRTDS